MTTNDTTDKYDKKIDLFYLNKYKYIKEMNLLNKCYSSFLNVANKSTISYPLAAAVMIDGKPATSPCCNIQRSYCRGFVCGSLHAEANALRIYFGKKLQFDSRANRWYLLQDRCKKGKEG